MQFRRFLVFMLVQLSLLSANRVDAQSFVHEKSDAYQWPDDPLVVSNLKEWQDLKFGIILHWGVYSVPGICESWTITSEDWITPDTTRTYDEYKQWYWGLSADFNPKRFNPSQWARVAREAGMKYMVFTTKHHDGFCLWDSRQTDYTVTHSGMMGRDSADVARYVFEAFRQEGIKTGCYFSKPDWHSPYYWWPVKATPNRRHNYKISDYPERWAQYQHFVYNQVEELMSGYGKMDILWLDGGWCTLPHEDIRLDSIVAMARSYQPGLIVVDRACPGPHENYQTPEQTIPDTQILNPWESCMTLTYDWGWTDHPVFKTPAKIIAVLSEVVAKGGSLLLGVGPTPDGIIEEGAEQRLLQVGRWLTCNGAAIYGTVPTPVYCNEAHTVWFTADKTQPNVRYGIVPAENGLPATVTWKGNQPRRGSRIVDLATGRRLNWTCEQGAVTVTLPTGTQAQDGVAFRFEVVE